MITFVAQTVNQRTDPTSGTYDLPAGWIPGDLAIFVWVSSSNNKVYTQASGVTTVHDSAAASSGRTVISYRVLQAGDTSFSWTATHVTGEDYTAVVLGTCVFRGSSGILQADLTPVNFTGTGPDPTVFNFVSDAISITVFGKSCANTSPVIVPTPPTGYTLGMNREFSTYPVMSLMGLAYKVLGSVTPINTENPGAWIVGGLSTEKGFIWAGTFQIQYGKVGSLWVEGQSIHTLLSIAGTIRDHYVKSVNLNDLGVVAGKPGSVWVEGGRLYWIGEDNHKYYRLSNDLGAVGGKLGSIWTLYDSGSGQSLIGYIGADGHKWLMNLDVW